MSNLWGERAQSSLLLSKCLGTWFPTYCGLVWSKGTTNKGTGNPILTYFLRGGDLIVKFPKIVTNVTFGKGLTF